jgi:hypothetical protein
VRSLAIDGSEPSLNHRGAQEVRDELRKADQQLKATRGRRDHQPGVGFFDIPHTQKPHAVNFAELHPVTAIKFVSGCGA